MKSYVIYAVCALVIAAGHAYAADYSIDRLKLAKADLPAGYELGSEIRTISMQPVTFYNAPDQMGMLPKPVKKCHQELRFNGETRGTLMMFQYRNADEPARIEGFLKGLLWGDPTGPAAQHPEELYIAGNVVFIFCFGYQSEESGLVKDILREKKGVVIGGPEDPFKRVIAKAGRYYNKSDAKKGIAYLKKEYVVIKDRSLGQYCLAGLYYMVGDWVNAGEHYRLALGLHEGRDPLPTTDALWESNHGLGISLAMAGRVKESIGPLAASLDLGRKNRQDRQIASSAYDLSCTYAVLKDFPRAYPLLAEAIRLDVKYKTLARGDDCFKEALAEKRFSDLLK